METITLTLMTKELYRKLYKDWENDTAIYIDMSLYKPFVYNETAVDRYYESRQEPSRVMYAIMLGDKPVGELQLKRIDRENRECMLSVHMQNDAVKGRGYGTQAECLAVRYAFDELDMKAVNADCIKKNVRSQHVLEKVGFRLIGEDGDFGYCRIEK